MGVASVPVALAIAVVMAFVVGLVFMELRSQGYVVGLTLVAAAAFIVLLVGFMYADVMTRPARPPLPGEFSSERR